MQPLSTGVFLKSLTQRVLPSRSVLNPLLRAGLSTTLKDNTLIVSRLKNRRVLNDFTVGQKSSGRIFFAFLEIVSTFAVESSQGIRVEGMTTLSRQLDSSPKVSVPGWLYFFAIMQYSTYSSVLF